MGKRVQRWNLWPWALALLVLACKAKKDPEFETVPADRGRIVAKVTATGTLSALVTVLVGAQVSGRIQTLKADFNTRVRKGDVLAQIDTQLFDAAVEQAKANLLQAQGALAKAQANSVNADLTLKRNTELAERDLVAQADLDTAKANAASARADVVAAQGNIAQAKASLHQAQTNRTYTVIVSPIDGVVISRAVDVGQTVASSLQTPTLFTIAQDLHKMQVDTNVAESDVGKLEPGMPVSFRVDAYPGEVFRGKVRQIRNAATTLQNVVTYDSVIDVANPEEKLRPGMTANVTFVYATREDALRVPNAALRFHPPASVSKEEHHERPDGGAHRWTRGERGPTDQRTIWVLRNEKPVPAEIHIGVSDGSFTEVASGELQEHDLVITDTKGGTPVSTPTGGRLPGMGGGGRRGF
jgi:HlyD family secretion protein